MEKLLLVFLYFTEESALIFYVGLGLLGYRLSLKLLALTSFLQGILAYVVRWLCQELKIPLGTHVLLLVVTMVLLLRFLAKIKIGSATASVLVGSSLVLLGDNLLLLPYLQKMGHSSLFAFKDNVFSQILYGYLSSTFLILAALLHRLTGFKLIDLAQLEMEQGSIER